MKLTKSQLKQIIKEELEKTLNEFEGWKATGRSLVGMKQPDIKYGEDVMKAINMMVDFLETNVSSEKIGEFSKRATDPESERIGHYRKEVDRRFVAPFRQFVKKHWRHTHLSPGMHQKGDLDNVNVWGNLEAALKAPKDSIIYDRAHNIHGKAVEAWQTIKEIMDEHEKMVDSFASGNSTNEILSRISHVTDIGIADLKRAISKISRMTAKHGGYEKKGKPTSSQLPSIPPRPTARHRVRGA